MAEAALQWIRFGKTKGILKNSFHPKLLQTRPKIRIHLMIDGAHYDIDMKEREHDRPKSSPPPLALFSIAHNQNQTQNQIPSTLYVIKSLQEKKTFSNIIKGKVRPLHDKDRRFKMVP